MKTFLLSIVCMFGVTTSVQADVAVSNLFTDHMVVQQGKPVIIWGTAESGEAVTVAIAGKADQVTADADGKWTAKLPALKANSGPHTITIKASNLLAI